ncbi:hypothetical protein AL073_14935 [Loktanella sp. 1ANDIMAR09]|nr:hypothetical protein AL073_14935 [Loktanella sp. 1ANDIMAR09]
MAEKRASRTLSMCGFAIAIIVVSVIGFVEVEAAPMCDLPEDAKGWIGNKTLEQTVAEWPTLLQEGPIWQAFVAASEERATAEQLALIQSCREK